MNSIECQLYTGYITLWVELSFLYGRNQEAGRPQYALYLINLPAYTTGVRLWQQANKDLLPCYCYEKDQLGLTSHEYAYAQSGGQLLCRHYGPQTGA